VSSVHGLVSSQSAAVWQGSNWQNSSQPSPFIKLPSSHSSCPCLIPLPQSGTGSTGGSSAAIDLAPSNRSRC
jgi:hypothetical protein